MKQVCKVVLLVGLGITQSILPAITIKLARGSDAGLNVKDIKWSQTYSYKLKTTKNYESQSEYTRPKTFKKETKVSFDPNLYEIVLQVYPNAKAEGDSYELELKKSNIKSYEGKDNKGANVFFDTLKMKLLFVKKDASPFAKTHKVSVEKEKKDGELLSLASSNTNQQETEEGFVYTYGAIKIKQYTNPGQGLPVPTDRAFDLQVNGNLSYAVSEAQAKTLKKLKYNKENQIVAVDTNGKETELKGSVASPSNIGIAPNL